MHQFIKNLINSFIISGIIVLLIGVYYLMIKAGIPYQDPPPELQIAYSVNEGIGSVLCKTGFIVTVISVILRVVFGVITKKK